MKAEKRTLLGLPPLPEDSIKVIRNMRAASPPASASDLIEQQQKRGRREHKVRQQRAQDSREISECTRGRVRASACSHQADQRSPRQGHCLQLQAQWIVDT